MTTGPAELAGLLAGCGAAALAVVARDPRLRLGAVAAALIAAPILVAGDVWSEPRIVAFREDAPAVALSALAVLALIAALALAFIRFPAAFPVLAVAALPLRVPVEIGGETANLLIPLYAVIAAGAAAAIVALARDPVASRACRGFWPLRGAGGWLRWLLAATLILYAAQAGYSRDVSNAIENSGFFLIPFAALFALLASVRWTRRLLGLVAVAVGAVAVLVASIAIYQYVARDLFLNEELLEANQIHQYFRVNSLFFDPNILGRYLALAITVLAAYVAWGSDPRRLAAAVAAAAVVLLALTFSFSITSIASLAAGLGVLAVLRWRLRGAAVAAGMAVAASAVLIALGGVPETDLEADREFGSGRPSLISGGLELAADRPLAGWGSGSFGVAFWEQIEPARMTISHAEPVTVAAEQGALGLVVYLPLLAVSLLVLLGGTPRDSAARAAVGACFVVMVVHSVGYAGFAIDPATWALLGLGLGLRD